MEPNFKPGDILRASDLNDLVRDRSIDVRGDGGISVRSSADGQVQIIHHFTGAFAGTASGTITTRVGTSLGYGTVEIFVKNPSTGSYVDSGIALTCDNLSSTSGGIPSGTWVAGFFQDDGTPLVMTADCGN
jgi:hypothetical protein